MFDGDQSTLFGNGEHMVLGEDAAAQTGRVRQHLEIGGEEGGPLGAPLGAGIVQQGGAGLNGLFQHLQFLLQPALGLGGQGTQGRPLPDAEVIVLQQQGGYGAVEIHALRIQFGSQITGAGQTAGGIGLQQAGQSGDQGMLPQVLKDHKVAQLLCQRGMVHRDAPLRMKFR